MNWLLVLVVGAGTAAAIGDGLAQDRELIADPQFEQGFTLWEPKPGAHVRYGQLSGFPGTAPPVWGLSQWSSKFPLAPDWTTQTRATLGCSNAAKGIVVARRNRRTEFSMAVNSAVEYGRQARPVAAPWVHLLVEQEFRQPAPLRDYTQALLHIEARLLRSRNLHQGDYSPGAHAAQFQIFFTVQNRNHASPGYGDLLWFGVPIYDNRDRFPQAFKARDFGGTAKFIFTPDGRTYSKTSAQDGQWVTIEHDLLPLMREALTAAWAGGFLPDSHAFEDYAIGGMNMGWELPGTFDVELRVRKLSLRLKSRS